MKKYLYYYLIIINIIGLIMMGVDKKRARKHQSRLMEKLLFGIAFIGGSVGIWSGIWIFNHKTRHRPFTIGVPLIMVIQLTIIILIETLTK